MNSDPKPDPNPQPPQQSQSTATAVQPKCALLVMCLHCDRGIEALLPIDRDAIARLLAQNGWFTPVLTPPGQGPEVPILFAPLCSSCAPNVFPPEVLRAAEAQRQKMLQGAR